MSKRQSTGPLALLSALLTLAACSPRGGTRANWLGLGVPWLNLLAASASHSPPPRLVAPVERPVVKLLGGDGGDRKRVALSARLLLRADLDLAVPDDASFFSKLSAATDREITARGGKSSGRGASGGELVRYEYTRAGLRGSIRVWCIKGTRATHVAIWVDEEI